MRCASRPARDGQAPAARWAAAQGACQVMSAADRATLPREAATAGRRCPARQRPLRRGHHRLPQRIATPPSAARSDYWNTGPKELARLNCMQVSMSIATSVMATPQFDLGTRKDGNARYLVDGLPEAAVRWRFDTDPHPVRESTRTYPKRVRIYELMSRWQLALTTAWIGPWGCCARWHEPGDPSGSLSYRR